MLVLVLLCILCSSIPGTQALQSAARVHDACLSVLLWWLGGRSLW